MQSNLEGTACHLRSNELLQAAGQNLVIPMADEIHLAAGSRSHNAEKRLCIDIENAVLKIDVVVALGSNPDELLHIIGIEHLESEFHNKPTFPEP